MSCTRAINQAKRLKQKQLNLSERDIDYLPFELFQLDELESLDLSKNKIVEIDSNIYKLGNLRELNLSNNKIISLPKSLLKLENLETVILEGNPMLTEEIEYKPEEWRELFNKTEIESSSSGGLVDNESKIPIFLKSTANFKQSPNEGFASNLESTSSNANSSSLVDAELIKLANGELRMKDLNSIDNLKEYLLKLLKQSSSNKSSHISAKSIDKTSWISSNDKVAKNEVINKAKDVDTGDKDIQKVIQSNTRLKQEVERLQGIVSKLSSNTSSSKSSGTFVK